MALDPSRCNYRFKKEVLERHELYNYLHASDTWLYPKRPTNNHAVLSSTLHFALGSGCIATARESNFLYGMQDAVLHYANQEEFWREYVAHFDDFEIIGPKYSWEEWKVGVGPPPIKTDRGWLVIYHGVNAQRIYRVGALLLDLDEPAKILARTRMPILEPEMEFEKRGLVPNVVFPEGAVIRDGDLLTYYGGADRVSCVAKAQIDDFLDELERGT